MMGSALIPVRTLKPLLAGFVEVPADADVEISALVLDSRSVTPGALFLGIRGDRLDGRKYVPEAVQAGAAAVVCDAEWKAPDALAVPCFIVDDLRRKIALIANRFYGFPSRLLCIVGLTGTNGKTTCGFLLAQALNHLGRRSAFIGTIGSGLIEQLEPNHLTTPDAIELQQTLADFVGRDAHSVCMEVSSHALSQHRVEGVEFDVALFTNISRDHLDYHQDMSAYVNAKLMLFRRTGLNIAVINHDDPHENMVCKSIKSARIWTYGVREGADIYPLSVDSSFAGLYLRLATPAGEMKLRTSLFGQVNVPNIAAVVATLLALDYHPADIVDAMAVVVAPPGRMESFERERGDPRVFVDYAHTPVALEGALRSLKAHSSGKIWCVFGCGGERDRGKRSVMGAVADRWADEIVLTNDNPRGESPDQIITDIEAGIESHEALRQPDRAKAIYQAIKNADEDDIVLIAGKGHEQSQLIGNTLFPFCDREVVTNLLRGNA